MKEINFLPKWYKNNRKQRLSICVQRIAVGCVFVFIIIWNFALTIPVSNADRKLALLSAESSSVLSISNEFLEINGQLAELRKKTDVMLNIDSRFDVAAVFAELSFLVGEKALCSKMEFKAESLDAVVNGSVVSSAGLNDRAVPPVGDVRFKIVINGIAANAGEVANLICRLESSPYFCMVYPVFLKNKSMKISSDSVDENRQISEFEISCYFANFQIQNSEFAKDIVK